MNPRMSPSQEEAGSFFGKIKSLFSNDDQPAPRQPDYSRPLPTNPYGQSAGMYRQPPSFDHPPTQQQRRDVYEQSPPPMQDQRPPPFTENPAFFGNSPPNPYQHNSQAPPQHPGAIGDGNVRHGPFDQAPSQYPPQPNDYQGYGSKLGGYEVKSEPVNVLPPEPQAFVAEDSIVLILKPNEFFRFVNSDLLIVLLSKLWIDFYRKKAIMTAMGPANLQVFSDFEHVFTKFRAEDGSEFICISMYADGAKGVDH
jgi:hypothetical protein